MSLHGTDALVARLWNRHRDRWLGLAWLVALGVFGVAVAVAITFHVLYHRPSTAVGLRSYAIVIGWIVVVHRFMLVPQWRRATVPIRDWLQADAPSEANAVAAWECARSLTVVLARQTALTGGPATLVGVTLYFAIDYDLGGMRLAIVAMAAGLAIAWVVANLAPAFEVFFRPVRRELAQQIPHSAATAKVGVTMRTKLLVTAFLMCMLSGASIAVAATVGDRDLEELGELTLVALVIPVTTGGMAFFLLARSLLAPIDDLLVVTEQFTEGDHTARAIVTTDDEIGSVALGVNSMLDDLEALVEHNQVLLEEVLASRARIVAASDAERRRIERNIHDGVQQRMTSIVLRLGIIEARADEPAFVREKIAEAMAELRGTHEELRELARGLHPAILTTDGLLPALEQLAERSAIPVSVSGPPTRFGTSTESTAYFVASEALANVTKYSQATHVTVRVEPSDGGMVLEVADDGIGGAHLGPGSGLTGLADRVEAIGGRFTLDSPANEGTTIRVALPVEPGS